MSSLLDLLSTCPQNPTIGDNLVRAYSKINSSKYSKIICSISGGADSDVMLDICHKCDYDHKIDYVWYDTGLEYQATKEHLRYLESRYGISIKRFRAIKPIPISCKTYGLPFLSKRVSEYIHRLQLHNFTFEDKSFEELYQQYPKCKTALGWWCNQHQCDSFNIRYNKLLKEFLIENPPTFPISPMCCQYAKKKVAHAAIDSGDYDLNIYGVRKFEGGTRNTGYHSCFDEKENGCDNYRPLYWYTNQDRLEYEQAYSIEHSRCYTEYGLKRTGCAGCPFGRNFEDELQIIKTFEPQLYKAVNNIFGKSYEYTRQYKEFCQRNS